MLLTSLILLLAQGSPPLPTPLTDRRIQQCPDGSVILATERCIALTPHIYLLSHEPQLREIGERWWCGRSAKPNEARLSITLQQPSKSGIAPAPIVSIVSLSLGGRPLPPALRERIAATITELRGVTHLYGRCLNRPSGEVIGVLILRNARNSDRSIEVELR